MPNKKSDRRKGGKKTRGRKGASRSIPSTLLILPPAFRRVYCSYQSMNSLPEGAAGAGAIYQFRLNSLYDPDFSGVGTTAAGYTALASTYGLFRVLSVRVIVSAAMFTNGIATVGMVPGLNGTVTSTIFLLQMQPHACSRVLQGNTGGSRSVATFDRTYNIPRVCGMTKAQYVNEMDYAHIGGSNPARSVYLALFMAGQSPTAQTVIFTTRIIYEVEVSNPLQTVIS